MATKKFRCKVCGYIHEGNKAPEKCPVCQAPASEFELISGGGIDKNSNWYIILYSTVMVVIVATLLAFTALSLQKRQNENVLNEKKNAILKSLGEVDANGAVTKNYEEFITAYAVDENGQTIADVTPEQALDMLFYLKDAFAANKYPVFRSADGRYVLPVIGQGLWDVIWGYVALNADKNSVYGVYFSHASETPGLGAEIASKPFFEKFPDKKVLDAAGSSVALGVMKNGKVEDPSSQVDGISGGTITSNGVDQMLKKCLSAYMKFLTSKE